MPRGVAQSGSALAWGARGPRFKSGRPDFSGAPQSRGSDVFFWGFSDPVSLLVATTTDTGTSRSDRRGFSPGPELNSPGRLRRWKLAGLSAGGAAAAVASIVAHQLLQPIILSVGEPGSWWVQAVIGLGMSLSGVGGLAAGYRVTLRWGAKVARQGRERPLLVFLVGAAPWLLIGLWIVSVATL